MSSSLSNIMYIYNLPHQERRELCRILDQNDKWEELGGTFMKFDVMTLQVFINICSVFFGIAKYYLQDIRREILRGHSPTEELLTMWGHQNHTVLELFVLLSRMQHYQSMVTLKPFVDSKYHKLILEGEQNLSNLIQNLQVVVTRNKNEPCTKDLGIAEHNFQTDGKILNRPVVVENKATKTSNENIVSDENNESVTENNNLRLNVATTVSKRNMFVV